MKELLMNSLYLGMTINVGIYLLSVQLRKEVSLATLNLLLMPVPLIIAFLLVLKIDYQDYNEEVKYLGYSLTPTMVRLAILLCKQLELLKHHSAVMTGGIAPGVLASAFSIFALSKLFGLGHEHYVTLLPRPTTTAIGIGVSEEAGGIMMLTVVSIIITGTLGDAAADVIFRLFKIEEPVARGLVPGTSAYIIGTVGVLEMGETEGTMFSLVIVVVGLLTIAVIPPVSGLI